MIDMAPTRTFAQSMRAIRQHRGLSAQNLADLPDFPLTRAKISKLENLPDEPIRLDDAVKVAKVLGFSLELMIDGTAPHYVGLPELVRELNDRLDAITGRGADEN